MISKITNRCAICNCKISSIAWMNQMCLCKKCYQYKKRYDMFPKKEYIRQMREMGKWT